MGAGFIEAQIRELPGGAHLLQPIYFIYWKILAHSKKSIRSQTFGLACYTGGSTLLMPSAKNCLRCVVAIARF